jgi:hypothetical protein
MRNLSIEKGLVKNARVQVVKMLSNVIDVRLLQQLQQISEQGESTFSAPNHVRGAGPEGFARHGR